MEYIFEMQLIESDSSAQESNGAEQTQKWKFVDKQTFLKFLKEYPVNLEYDHYMDVSTWNDFSNGKKWPESIVASVSDGEENYRIWPKKDGE